MSYASVTSQNIPPLSQQPHPDPALLTTSVPHDETVPDVDRAKVSVVAHDFNEHPVTNTITVEHSDSSSEDEEHENVSGSRKRKARRDKARARQARAYRAERKMEGWVDWTKRAIFRPEIAGGVFAVVNIGVLGTVGYHVYHRPALVTKPRENVKPLAIIGTGLLGMFALEGWAAEAYLETDQGQVEFRRVQEEGHYLYSKTQEVVLRPKVASGLLGIANLAILSGLGWFTYVHWDTPVVTKRNVSIASIGLIGWFSAQGYIIEKYRQDHYDEFGKLGDDHRPKTFTERLNAERAQRAVDRSEKSTGH